MFLLFQVSIEVFSVIIEQWPLHRAQRYKTRRTTLFTSPSVLCDFVPLLPVLTQRIVSFDLVAASFSKRLAQHWPMNA